MAVQEAMFDPFEYLMARHKDGLLKLDFKAALGRVSYHIPCHGRVQKIGKKTEEVFKLIGETVAVQLNSVERCSGHAGTYGVKTAYHANAMKIGKPVFKAMMLGVGNVAQVERGAPKCGERFERLRVVAHDAEHRAVRRLLREKYDLGLFENPFVDADR